MANNENRELIVSIQTKMDRIPFSRLYTKLQVDLPKLSWHALLDLDEMLNDVEQMGHPIKRQKVAEPVTVATIGRCEYCSQVEDLVAGLCEDCAADEEEAKQSKAEEEDDCPECNGGEVYEGEADVSSCGRCEGTGTLS